MTEQHHIVSHRASGGPATAAEHLRSAPFRGSVHGSGQGARQQTIQGKW